jgi:hypothetical protein
MLCLSSLIRPVISLACTLCTLLLDVSRFLCFCLRPSPALAAENLFLRKQLALYQEHHVTPRCASNAVRITLLWLSQWFDWQPALAVVHPETFKRWRRQGYHLFWHWTPCLGRPPIPVKLQRLIGQMARDNLTWGQRRIANELRLKLGLQVSPRTVRKYMPKRRDWEPSTCVPSQRWRTFVRNHAGELISSGMSADFLTRGAQVVSARIRRFLQRWWSHAVASGVQGGAPRDAVALLLLIDTRLVLAAWSLGTVEVISEDNRSPPDMRPPCHHNPFIAARATPVDTLALRPAVGTGCWWIRTSASSRSAKPLSKSKSQAIL